MNIVHASPTSLSIFGNNCPYAYKCYQDRKETQEYEVECGEMAGIGICFHAMAHQAALAEQQGKDVANIIEATCLVLTQKHRPDHVWEAKEMAERFLSWWKFPTGFQFEHGLAFDNEWKKTAWDASNRRIRLVLDTIGIANIETEEYSLKVAMAQDYKSGWGCSADDLNSIQMDAYVATLYSLFKNEVDAIQIEIVSIPHNQTYSKLYLLNNEEDVKEIQKRIKKLEFVLQAVEVSNFTPIVGLGCILCRESNKCKDYLAHCKDIQNSDGLLFKDKVEATAFYAVMKKAEKMAEKYLRIVVDAEGPIKANGQILAYHEQNSKKVKESYALLEVFLKAYPDIKIDFNLEQLFRSFMSLLKPSNTQFESVVGGVAKQIGYKTKKAAVEELGAKDLSKEVTLKFGLKSDKKGE